MRDHAVLVRDTSKKNFEVFSDWFVALSDPTPEQANEFRKIENEHRSIVGLMTKGIARIDRTLELLR